MFNLSQSIEQDGYVDSVWPRRIFAFERLAIQRGSENVSLFSPPRRQGSRQVKHHVLSGLVLYAIH